MDKPNYVGSSILYMSKLQINETYCNKLQPFFCQEILHLQYIDTNGKILSIKTQNNVMIYEI